MDGFITWCLQNLKFMVEFSKFQIDIEDDPIQIFYIGDYSKLYMY